jgi:hypothetical protein
LRAAGDDRVAATKVDFIGHGCLPGEKLAKALPYGE